MYTACTFGTMYCVTPKCSVSKVIGASHFSIFVGGVAIRRFPKMVVQVNRP